MTPPKQRLIMNDYTTLKLGSYTHVLVTHQRATMSDANFLRSGKAICGILLPGETLKQFLRRKEKAKIDIKKTVALIWRKKYRLRKYGIK